MSSLERKLGMYEWDMNVIKAKDMVIGQSSWLELGVIDATVIDTIH